MYRFFLKIYLKIHSVVFARVMYHLAPKVYGGNHPKNIFHYRSEFFIENVSNSDAVLDLACGQGAILKRIAPYIRSGIGVDQNSKMLALARADSPPNLDFRDGNIFGPGIKKILDQEKITKITLSHILEHLEDPVAFMRGLQGKELLICVPSEENWYRQLLMDLGLPFLSDPTHFREYSRALLKEHLAAANYEAKFIGFNSEGEIICRALAISAPL